MAEGIAHIPGGEVAVAVEEVVAMVAAIDTNTMPHRVLEIPT